MHVLMPIYIYIYTYFVQYSNIETNIITCTSRKQHALDLLLITACLHVCIHPPYSCVLLCNYDMHECMYIKCKLVRKWQSRSSSNASISKAGHCSVQESVLRYHEKILDLSPVPLTVSNSSQTSEDSVSLFAQ